MIEIRVQQLTKRFGRVVALDQVSLTIEPGELFFLLGPSGCGKTTLLRCIAGFYMPDEGALHFDHENITRLPAHKRNTGMVFQNYALWPHMTVAQNVAFGLRERGTPKAERERRVREMLARVRMEEYAGRKPNQLSGGQQQRVALARALVIEPRCLLLDEPLSNLDARLRLETRDRIRSLCKQAGMTAIYVTHDQKEALAIADRVAIFDQGRIRQIGVPNEVYRRPADRFVAAFIGESNFLDGEVRAVENGQVMIATSLGVLVSRTFFTPPKPRDKVAVCLRPEALRIIHGEESAMGASGAAKNTSAPAGRVNTFNACIVQSVYLGELAQHRVIVGAHGERPGGGPLECEFKVFEMNPRVMAGEGENIPILCRVDPMDVIVAAPS